MENFDELSAIGLTALAIFSLIRMLLRHIRQQRLAALQSETLSRVLDKLGQGPEVLAWLQTGDTKKFFDLRQEQQAHPASRIFFAAQAGAILLFAGIALLIMFSRHGKFGLELFGGLGLAIGAGFLVSAAFAYYQMNHVNRG